MGILSSRQQCPCGMTQEQLDYYGYFERGICFAPDANNQPCNRRLVDHPHSWGRFFRRLPPRTVHNSNISNYNSTYNIVQQVGDRKRMKLDSKTPTNRGRVVVQDLKASGSFIILPPINGGEPFFSDVEQAEARQVVANHNHERFLVAYLLPKLKQKLPELEALGLKLINSEEYPWVEQPDGADDTRLAPDFYAAPQHYIDFMGPYTNAPNSGNIEYGRFYPFKARRSVRFFGDAKTQLADRGIGDFVPYLQFATGLESSSLSFEEFHSSRGLLCDAENFYIMEAANSAIVKICYGTWTQPGSLQHIRQLLGLELERHPWDIALEDALHDQGAQISIYSSREPGRAMLGGGAMGRVFRVTREGQPFALKLVLEAKNVAVLEREFTFIHERARLAVPNNIVGVVEGSYRAGSFEVESRSRENEPFMVRYASYLMPIVGQQVTAASVAVAKAILVSLSELHIAGIAHGDARLPNVVRYENRYLWIDFVGSSVGAIYLDFVTDVKDFLESIGRTILQDTNEAILAYARRAASADKWPTEEARINQVTSILDL